MLAVVGAGLGFGTPAASAQTAIQQCGQQYQAAKANNQLNGQNWTQFRVACMARLKGEATSPTAAPAATPATTPATTPNPLRPATNAAPAPAPVATAPAPTTPTPTTPAPTAVNGAPILGKNGKPMSAGHAAFVARERQCGAEWRANKASLVAQTPGLTWPKYLSQCNTRLKAAGQ